MRYTTVPCCGIQAVGRAAAEGGRWNGHAATMPGGLRFGRREFRGMWEDETMPFASGNIETRAHGGVHRQPAMRCVK